MAQLEKKWPIIKKGGKKLLENFPESFQSWLSVDEISIFDQSGTLLSLKMINVASLQIILVKEKLFNTYATKLESKKNSL